LQGFNESDFGFTDHYFLPQRYTKDYTKDLKGVNQKLQTVR
jgi:hypothetical protein